MLAAILDGLYGLTTGLQALATLAGLKELAMMAVGAALIYLGVKRDVEPLLLVPIGFGCLLANIPLQRADAPGPRSRRTQVFDLLELTPDAAKEMAKTETGFLRTIFNFGIANELFPLLIFIGIGAMTDFTPLLANPKILLFGAAGQFGIFVTLLLALALGFSASAGDEHRHHRRLRRADRDLCRLALRAGIARPDIGGGLFLHGAGADHPAADHAGAHHREGAHASACRR